MIKYKYTINGDYTRCNKNIIEEFNSKKQILEGADLEDFIWSDSMENNPNCKETIIKARKKGRSNFSFNEYCKVYSPEDYRAQKESKPEWTNSFLADKYFVWSDSMEENPNCIETVIRRHLDTNEIDKVTNRKNRNYGK